MTQDKKNKFAYYLGNTMYINITNLCTNKCKFCIRDSGDSIGGVSLVLDDEKFTADDIIKEIQDNFSNNSKEIVFCGYGEPLMKLDMIKSIAKFIKKTYPDIPTRINTNGHANLIHKRNIVHELVGLIDKISISLNAQDADLYAKLTSPCFDKETAYEGVKFFIKECAKSSIETTATVVSGFPGYEIDTKKCETIAQELGAEFRIREWLPDGYDS